MPQNSAIYGATRIRCNEKGLIGSDKLQRMIDGTAEEAMRLLVDAGYGSLPDATVEDAERLITSELNDAYALVREVTYDPATTDIFLMRSDVHNLKLLFKLRILGSSERPAYMAGGCFSTDALEKMVQNAEYRDLPAELKTAMASLEQSVQAAADPAQISITLDRAYVKYAMRAGNAFVKKYFAAQSDFDNVIAMLRIRAVGGGADKLKSALLPEGEIPASRLVQAMEAPLDGMAKLVATGPARTGIMRALEAMQKGAGISVLERERDDYLMSLVAPGRFDESSILPVLGYLLAREQEAKCVRLVLTAKRNGLPESVITERLRELYG